MIGKAIKPDWSQIVNGLYATAIVYVAPIIFSATLLWLSSFDPLELKVTQGQITAIMLYVVMAIGFGTIGYGIVRLFYRVFPPTVLRFSMALDKEIRKSSFSGRGVIFLNGIKKAPPFLGIKFSKPVIQPQHEKIMTEYFMALDFFNKYGSQIKGGGSYQIRGEETWEEVSEKIYGSNKFVPYILAANQSVSFPPPRGSFISSPRVDISSNTGLTPEVIDYKYSIMKSDVVSKTLVELMNNFDLVWDEPLNLMSLVWKTAALSKRGKQKNAS